MQMRKWTTHFLTFSSIQIYLLPKCELLSQENNRLFISGGLFIEHLGGNGYEGSRQGAATHGADMNAAHTVDADIVQRLIGVLHGNGTNRALLGADAALDAVFVYCGMESRGFQLHIGIIAGDMHGCRILQLCLHIRGKLTAEGFILSIGRPAAMERTIECSAMKAAAAITWNPLDSKAFLVSSNASSNSRLP